MATGYKIIQTSGHGCEKCNDKDLRTDTLGQVRESERRTYLDGKAVETETHFRCASCGSNWVNFTEEGLGGYGSFWIPE
jgi:transposase-like protein